MHVLATGWLPCVVQAFSCLQQTGCCSLKRGLQTQEDVQAVGVRL